MPVRPHCLVFLLAFASALPAGAGGTRCPRGDAWELAAGAERALARADWPRAADLYGCAARSGDDPELAERATRIAYENRQLAQAVAAARRWLEIAPDSEVARRHLATGLRRLYDDEAAGAQFAGLLDSSYQDRARGAMVLLDIRHRLGNYDGWVDTLPYGAHHRWVLDKIGYFDEQLVRNQDDEFNMRIHLAGGKIWMSSQIWSIYYARSTLKKLWRQYFQYGFWRIRTIQKHKKPATARQLAPMLLVLSLVFLVVGGFL